MHGQLENTCHMWGMGASCFYFCLKQGVTVRSILSSIFGCGFPAVKVSKKYLIKMFDAMFDALWVEFPLHVANRESSRRNQCVEWILHMCMLGWFFRELSFQS
eukprot:4108631-Amphidinium_carterae.1